MKQPQREWTVGAIARHHNAPVHRVEYVITSRGIQPASRAGNLRIFSDENVQLIGRALVSSSQSQSEKVV